MVSWRKPGGNRQSSLVKGSGRSRKGRVLWRPAWWTGRFTFHRKSATFPSPREFRGTRDCVLIFLAWLLGRVTFVFRLLISLPMSVAPRGPTFLLLLLVIVKGWGKRPWLWGQTRLTCLRVVMVRRITVKIPPVNWFILWPVVSLRLKPR